MDRRCSKVWLALAVVVTVSACGNDGSSTEPDASRDAPTGDLGADAASMPDAPMGEFCREDIDCTPAAGAAPCAITFCDRTFLRCKTTGPDLDADGHADDSCDPGTGEGAERGDDCDDADPARFPGRPEICDAIGHDEDCNSTVISGADGDTDGDGSYAMTCCNRDDATGELLCGADCNDADSAVNPAATDGPDVACDGVDNDCDLEVDEGCGCRDGQTRRCGTDVGECLPGMERCAAGAWGECVGGVGPTPEDCDGDDDDCNTVDDDGCACVDGTSRGCGIDEGECIGGVQRCEGGVWSSLCEGATGPAPEMCDGDDDDCNGTLDDGCDCLDGATQPCPGGTDVGECMTGTQTCVAGGWAPCFGGVGPTVEICDGVLDHNCNGRTDTEDGCACTTGMSAACGGGPVSSPPARCMFGVRMCVDGTLGACEGSVDPVAETCNAFDDDCDGLLNEEPEASASCAAMGATATCVSGSCVISGCAAGTADCDTSPANGCETSTTTTSNCGRCGNVCDAGESCIGGVCDPVRQLAAGLFHTCARRESGRVLCWGSNTAGQLGNGMSGSGMMSTSPVQVVGLSDAVEIAAGYGTSCARRTSGQVVCWGGDSFGELGNGGGTALSSVPVDVVGLTSASDIAGGGQILRAGHFCARQGTGVQCWGFNNSGQLGNGSGGGAMFSASPVAVMSLSDAVELALGVGGLQSCARRSGGTVSCWGAGYGNTPAAVAGVSFAATIAAGGGHQCVTETPTGSVRCWGANDLGQLGDGTTDVRTAPVSTLGIAAAVQVALSSGTSCARLGAGEVRCWGDSTFGELGDGSSGTGIHRSTAAAVPGLTDATEVAAGADHFCAARRSGQVVCWGSNLQGQLGNGSGGVGMLSATPVAVIGIP